MAKAARKRFRNFAIITASLLAAVVAVVAGGVAVVVHAPLPQHDGVVKLAGLSGDVSVERDSNGIPHIYANSDTDLFFAQGYTHAQDRFFEMDYRRHLTGGRLTELVGGNDSAKQADVVIRTMGWRALAEEEWNLISAESRSFYEAYAAGVNAYIAGKQPWQIANEYAVLGLSVPVQDIEPWQGVDSLAWLKAMAWDLKANIEDEQLRLQAFQSMQDVAAVEKLFPPYLEDRHKPVIPSQDGSNLRPREEYPIADPLQVAVPAPVKNTVVSSAAKTVSDEGADSAAAAQAELLGRSSAAAVDTAHSVLSSIPVILGRGQGVGSNSFAISGKHTASGAPIIANDPHLGIDYPSVWYQIGLHCVGSGADCTIDVSGFSFSGMPGVIIGRNAELAWGLTNLGGDVADFVVEKNLDENTYERDGAAVPYEVWTETFNVAGGESYDVTVRRSVHGPIVSDLLVPNERVAKLDATPEDFSVALEWTALKPDITGDAIFAINRATNVSEVREAARLFAVPAQNILFATKSGDIGYQAPGRFPVRPHIAETDAQLTKIPSAANLGADGRWPRPGWDSRYDWQGYYAAADMPALLNPAEGFIVPANQQITPSDLGPYLGSYSDQGYRAQQIREGIEELIAKGDITLHDAEKIMLLDRSPYGAELSEHFIAADLRDAPKRQQQMQQLLQAWVAEGSHTTVDSVGATIAAALYAHLLNNTVADEFTGFQPNSGAQNMELLVRAFADPEAELWDDKATAARETAPDMVLRAFAAAEADLVKQLGADINAWEWGRVHVESPTHRVMGADSIPGVIRSFFNADPVGVPGGATIPNAMNFSPAVNDGSVSFEVTSGPSMRMAVDMSDPNSATWVISSGASGHPRSPNIKDQLPLWAAGDSLKWAFTPEAVEERSIKILRLVAGE
ncbi:penicillin acylase family protein [Canibacter zhoujuaniae]|uniref:penicillin acylase family protein n=1 Tax=Canibacter zhoujuaniae TaxID=2708343 RepID=UPI0014226518|nr:penicillin acylase family protein [Canibacter zhoujuaniae]